MYLSLFQYKKEGQGNQCVFKGEIHKSEREGSAWIVEFPRPPLSHKKLPCYWPGDELI